MSAEVTRLNGKRLAAVLALGASLIVPFEGRSLVAYLDPVGVPTICAGVTPGVKLGDTATPAECSARETAEMGGVLKRLGACIKRPLSNPQWAALTSWAYNVGTGAACGSTLVRMVNAGAAPADWCQQLHRWVYAGGSVYNGLVRRRAAEYAMCVGATP